MREEKISREEATKILEKLKEKTKVDAIRISLDRKKKPTLTSSKIGGIPYWKNIEDYPITEEGEDLILLAQINFAELPENKVFPSTGILQFFICPNNLYGLDFECPDNQDKFRVVYHKDIDSQ